MKSSNQLSNTAIENVLLLSTKNEKRNNFTSLQISLCRILIMFTTITYLEKNRQHQILSHLVKLPKFHFISCSFGNIVTAVGQQNGTGSSSTSHALTDQQMQVFTLNAHEGRKTITAVSVGMCWCTSARVNYK